MGDVSRLSNFSRKEIINLLPDSLDVADNVWQRVCPKNLVGPVEIFLVEPPLSENFAFVNHFLPS